MQCDWWKRCALCVLCLSVWNQCKSTAGAVWTSRLCHLCHHRHRTWHGRLRRQGNVTLTWHLLVIYDGVRLTLINFCSVWCCVCALLAVAWCLSVSLAVEQLDISSLVLSRRLHLTYPTLCFKEIQASSKIRVLHFQALHFKKCLAGSSIIAVCCQLSSTKLYTQFDGLDHHNAFVAMQFVTVSLHLRVQHDLWKAERCAGPSAIADACELLVFFACSHFHYILLI